jgi:cell division protein FtsW (lipid II flippase)
LAGIEKPDEEPGCLGCLFLIGLVLAVLFVIKNVGDRFNDLKNRVSALEKSLQELRPP